MKSIAQVIDFQQVTATSETNFSFNKGNIQAPSTNGTANLVAIHKLITTPQYKARFVQVQNMTRTLYEGHLSKTETEKLKNQIDYLKKDLGFYLPSGTKDIGHGANDLDFNGCVGFDLDFRFNGGDKVAQSVKDQLKKFDFISLLHLSSGGYGVKGLFLTDLKECDSELYSFVERQLFEFLAKSGITLSFDRHALGKTCYFAYDKDAYINLDAKPFQVDSNLYEAQKAFQKRSVSISKADNDDEVRQATNFLIEQKINVANCYLEYLGFTAACIHAFGTEGGDIAYQILENSESFNVSNFKKTFDNHLKSLSKPSSGGQATERTILFHAREHGFKFQHTAISGELDKYQFGNRDLFTVDRDKALQRIKTDKGNKIIVCEDSYIKTVEDELNAIRFVDHWHGKQVDVSTIVSTYSDLSKLNLDTLKMSTVYVFGTQNFGRDRYIYTANEIEKISQHTKVTLFADTPTYLNLANSITVIDRHTPNAKVIVSDNPQATFVEIIKQYPSNDVSFLDTAESINKQLVDYTKVKRSELYAANHKKTLFVLFDGNVGMMPEAFTQFENVVFVRNSEQKPCINMSTFCAANDTQIRSALSMLDNDVYSGNNEKMFYEAIKSQILAVRHNNGKWERCPNTEGVLENKHQIKLLLSDAIKFQEHIERLALASNQMAEVNETTTEISEAIKQTKIDLAIEKKAEFFEFLEGVEQKGISSLIELTDYVAQQVEMSRGAKVAYNRLKMLLKINRAFSTCFEAVRDSYNDWTKTKGRFLAAKIIKTNTKTGTSLQTFRDTTAEERYTKADLIEIARAILPMVKGDDKEVWKQMKRQCFIVGKTVRRDGMRLKLYEAFFLE